MAFAPVVELNNAPPELRCSIEEFFPQEAWEQAANISYLESGWNAFAVRDTRDPSHPCGAYLEDIDGVAVSAEWSIGYFQINACNFPTWNGDRLTNARENVGTAHMLWASAGEKWTPWYFSAQQLGLL